MKYFPKYFVLGLMLLGAALAYPQQSYEHYLSLAKEKIPLEKLKPTADSLLQVCLRENDLDQAIKIAHKFSIKAFTARDYNTAVAYSEAELAWYKQLSRVNVKYNDALYNAGRFNMKLQRYGPAQTYYEQILELDIDSTTTAQSYGQLAEIYYELDDPYSAVNYYKQSIAIHRAKGYNKRLIKNYLDLARIYEHINNPESLEKKLECLKAVDSLRVFTKMRSRDVNILNIHYAAYYNNQSTFNFDSSRAYYFKNIKRLLAKNDSSVLATTYANLANLYASRDKDSAYFYINKASTFTKSKAALARILNIKANYYIDSGNKDEALITVHKSLENSTKSSFKVDGLPDYDQLSNAYDKKVVLHALLKKARIYLSRLEVNGNSDAIDLALKNIAAADFLLDQMFLGAQERASKLLWRQTAANIYGLGVSAASAKEDYSLAFYYAEKKKAVLLTYEVVLKSAGRLLPDSLVEKQNKLNKRRLQLLDQLQTSVVKTVQKETEDQLFNTNQSLNNLNQLISQSFPEYRALREKTSLVSLADVKKSLNKKSLLLHYVWTPNTKQEQQLELLVIHKNQVLHFPIKNVDQIVANIQTYSQFLVKPFRSKQDQSDYKKVANELYKQLIPSELTAKFSKITNLIIVPDGPLYNLPFEALLTSLQPNAYLIKQYAISYVQSVSFKIVNTAIKRNAQIDYVGFAPLDFNYRSLSSLPNTKNEVEQASGLFSGVSLLDKRASRTAFFDKSKKAKILHLATHAQAKGNSWIAFNDSLVSLYELYSHQLPADLVVLSACSTSMGQKQEGEGVASLAQGFFYAGANSVVSTLWNTNDKSAAQVSASFYKNLENGTSKTEALRLAKIEYLKSASLSGASPYYWAPMILMGDENKLEGTGTSYAKHFIITAIVILFLLIFKNNIRRWVTNSSSSEQ